MAKRINLVKRRKELGLLQKDVAEKIGCSTSAYGMYETGARNPDLKTAKAISDALNTTVDQIFFDNQLNKTCNSADKPA